MAKYTKRPVEIEAVEWQGDFIVNGENIAPDWMKDALDKGTAFFVDQGELVIATLEGEMKAKVGDYIVKGVEGELYPVDASIFRKTYVPSGEGDGLAKTAPLMSSDDYKDRFVAEVRQVEFRHRRLCEMLERWNDGSLDFEPSCPKELLNRQRVVMFEYLEILWKRAEIEGIRL